MGEGKTSPPPHPHPFFTLIFPPRGRGPLIFYENVPLALSICGQSYRGGTPSPKTPPGLKNMPQLGDGISQPLA